MPHRSPITFWLLLAATISVDDVVFGLAAGEQYATLVSLEVVAQSLILGQLGIVCIWSALNPRPNVATQIAPWFAVVLAALIGDLHVRLPGHFRDTTTVLTCLGIFGLYTALLMAALWLVQRTNFWRRKMGSARTWQFSLLHILTVMTIIALLATVIRNSPIFGEDTWTNMIFTFSYVALAVASVIIWSFSWNWFLRLASVLGVSVLLGTGASVICSRLLGFDVDVFNFLHVFYLIQAIVFSMWLGIGPVLPPRLDADATRSEAPRVQS